VACNSFSHNKRGVDEVGRMVAEEMPRCFAHEVVKTERLGDHHLYTHKGPGGLPIVLAGHLDTLCPEDPSFNCVVEQGEKLIGPGVNDMKGGDVVILWTLKALEQCGLLAQLPLVCIFNGDEELGSPTSHHLFSGMRGKASAAFVFENGAPHGTVVVGRKGISRYQLHITGGCGHFGNLKGPKASAVQELANKVLAVEALNRADKGLVANVGRVEGGLAANAVAERAMMDFEFRYWDESVEGELRGTMEELAGKATVPGCALRLERLSYRPPMQPTAEAMRLVGLIQELSAAQGQSVVPEKRGGVSDANWLAYAGIPTVDGLGPLGDGDFTRDEYIITETLFQRIELTANLLLAVKDKGLLR